MRTTLTIEDDLAGILRRRARDMGISFKEVVNRALRRGIAEEVLPRPALPVRTRPHSFGFRPGIDMDRLNQLADELEAQSLSDRLGSGRA